ncbi:MAG: hypothetical protein EOO90_04710 [Pedobacter sp.]|nr:MAG: hypothetical protein EOO90_04710 [Pedobacter sp.]
MNVRLFLLVFLFFPNLVSSQQRLNESLASSRLTYIYKLTDSETQNIALRSQSVIDNTYFHTLVDSALANTPYQKKIPFGNYLQVRAIKYNLHYQLYDVKNVSLEFVNNSHDFQFYVKDLKGNLVEDAKIVIGKNGRVKFNKQTKLYSASYQKRIPIIKVMHDGVSNFFEYELAKTRNYRENWSFFRKVVYWTPIRIVWQGVKNVFKKGSTAQSNYKGYLVFSKPRYKPSDTVKFKAYVVQKNTKVIKNVPADVLLVVGNGKPPKKIATIQPYKDGGYTYNFKLSDTLGLKLDQNYQVKLVEAKTQADFTNAYFKYEDYELKSVNFNVRNDKSLHEVGSPINVYLKASDENGLTIPDGRVDIIATSGSVSKAYGPQNFIPDTLWRTEIKLDPVGETKLTLPDSIFPKADFSFSMKFLFKTSDNQTRSANQSLNYKYSPPDKVSKKIVTSLIKDSLRISYEENFKSVSQKATIVSYGENDFKVDSFHVNLPYAVKADYGLNRYQVTINNELKKIIRFSDFNPRLTVNAYQSKDSLNVAVQNENKVPFWYTIFSGKNILLKGYTYALDTVLKNTSKRLVDVRVTYYWNGQERIANTRSTYQPNLLAVTIIAPDVVYPGQEVKMKVDVKDVEGRPVPETDLTAYAFTSKFGDVPMPNFNPKGKSYKVLKPKGNLKADGFQFNAETKLNWERWSELMGLDSLEYYRFVRPNVIYKHAELLKDSTAQIAPFLVHEGSIDPASVVYVDNDPVYFSQTEQLQRYSFKVKPGTRNIRIRTATRSANFNVDVKAGEKLVLSVSSEVGNPLTNVKVESNQLSTTEAEAIDSHVIRITDNFSGEKTVLETDQKISLLNPPGFINRNRDLLVGPFNENIINFKTKDFNHNFLRESGYTYTFLPNLLKQKSYQSKYGFKPHLTSQPHAENDNYKQYALTKLEIDNIWNEYLNLRSATTQLFNYPSSWRPFHGQLYMNLDTGFLKNLPYIKNLILYKKDEPDFVRIYSGSQRSFYQLKPGAYKVMFLLKDNRFFTTNEVEVRSYGKQYYNWDSFDVREADSLSIALDTYIKSIKSNSNASVDMDMMVMFNNRNFDPALLTNTLSGSIFDEITKLPLPGVSVKIVGLGFGTTTAIDGSFSLLTPKNGKIRVSLLGYETVEVDIKNGRVDDVFLSIAAHTLQEVVVVGYGSSRKLKSLAGSVSMESSLAGRVDGLSLNQVRIRGTSSVSAEKPLVILDGIPFAGDISQLNHDDIKDMITLVGSEATAIYGARASSGVIIIKTNKGNQMANLEGELLTQTQTMRRNFSDEGFWKPQLISDKNGEAHFTVKFPDDITNWNTKVIAVNGKNQVGFAETSIRSFKTLSANFVSPLFAITGDSINVIGKLMNYSPLEEKVRRRFLFNNEIKRESDISFKNSYIDTLAIRASGKDSLQFEYTLKQDNGYFDGEIRKIPLLEAGVKETKGYFSAMLRDTTIKYDFDESLGKVSLSAEASVFPILLDEMDKVRRYEYMCNEQLASKLKSLLLEKKVREHLKMPFRHEKEISSIIKKLAQFKKPQGTWGWWQSSEEEMWISQHVVEAFLQAEKQGYKIDLNRKVVHNYLVGKLSKNVGYESLHLLRLLHLFENQYYLNDWIKLIEKSKLAKDVRLNERLQLMRLKQIAGMPISIESLMNEKSQTMFGNIYWGKAQTHFWDNSIQNTLLAYQILKTDGRYSAELEKIQRYFLEQRKDGQWRNTYESSLILENILPDLLKSTSGEFKPSLRFNDQVVTKFPYQHSLENVNSLTVTKSGAGPVYFSAYQQFQNPSPGSVNKEFAVKSFFKQEGRVASKLKAGTVANLVVEVEVKADADYVMIEIPIPAGCSYENKMQAFYGVEAHREYFKEKTSIFCTKLRQGKYIFTVDLMPRYSGEYILNPAKAEMMYFPVFFGRESMKKVAIN